MLSHLKIEEIAYQCGFNSKSAFHVAFRNSEGTTPSQYCKNLLQKLIEVLPNKAGNLIAGISDRNNRF